MSDTLCSVDALHGEFEYIERVAIEGGGSYSVPLCAACYRRREQNGLAGYTTRDTDGIIDRRVLVGIQPDGKRAHGAFPWHWCYGNQPVHVPGAVYEDSNEAAHLIRNITEAEAQRAYFAELRPVMATIPATQTGKTPRQLLRRAKRRHAR